MTLSLCTLCDRCGARSADYVSWLTCRECLRDVCPKCDVITERRYDNPRLPTTCCQKCHAELAVLLPQPPNVQVDEQPTWSEFFGIHHANGDAHNRGIHILYAIMVGGALTALYEILR